MTVTEDRMLLGVGVIAVATSIHYFGKWEQVKQFFIRLEKSSCIYLQCFTYQNCGHIMQSMKWCH